MTELRSGRFETIGQLWEYIHNEHPTLNFDSFQSQLNRLMAAGIVEVAEPPLSNFSSYVTSWRYGLRFWFSVLATLASVAVVELVELGFPWMLVRWIAGTFIVLVAPGYAITWALFPSKKHLSDINRLALTIVLSLFLVPAIGLLFNYTVLGIQPGPIALVLGVLAEGLFLIGAYREFSATQTS